MGFFKTLFTGYKLIFQDINRKHNDLFPRCFSGCGTGLMMIGSAVMAKTAMKDDVRDIIAEADAAIEEAKNKAKSGNTSGIGRGTAPSGKAHGRTLKLDM